MYQKLTIEAVEFLMDLLDTSSVQAIRQELALLESHPKNNPVFLSLRFRLDLKLKRMEAGI